MSVFQEEFNKTVKLELGKTLGIKNPMAVPSLKKIVLNVSTKDFLADKKNIELAADDLAVIGAQKPVVRKARISVATFKLREGDKIGLTMTLRGKRMYDFYEKLVKIVFPRMKDFNGVDPKGFDGRGNITLGFSENIIFPEIDSGKVDKIRSLQLTIVTSAKDNVQARALLEALGMKFKKENEDNLIWQKHLTL